MIYRDFNDHGYPIFGLHGITKDGMCECLNPECTALFKHPKISNWQHITVWDDGQIDVMEMTGQLDTGYGVLCNGLIVVDVDARNGGIDSYSKLVNDVPDILQCGMIVETGSGGGSKHLFFKAPKDVRLSSHLKEYPGIDFKNSGYVVGAGSMHVSGNRYRTVYGSVEEIGDAPVALVELLKAKERSVSNESMENLSDRKISEILEFISPDCDHDTWVRCGMAIHHETGGAGFEIWDGWSAKGEKYPGIAHMEHRWHSFGKSANVVTIGTLIKYAEDNGYVHTIGDDVVFVSDTDWGEVKEPVKHKKQDLLNPPGLVGRITKWINSRSLYPRENLAVAAALMSVSSAGGLRYRSETDGICGNLFAFCIAGSGTGKESILQSYTELMRRAGIAAAVHGNIKSEQEIYRNIIDHQASFYTIDEIGEMLVKIQGARKKSGSSSYLEGIIGALMGIYSKSNGIQLITGDAKKTLKRELQNELMAIERKKNDNEASEYEIARMGRLKELINEADTGIVNPYLNIFGFTAPSKFATLLDQDMADNGFFARALIFRELDDNPMWKENYQNRIGTDTELEAIGNILSNMYHAGHVSEHRRVETMGKIEYIPTSEKAKVLFEQIRRDFWEMGEAQKEREGLVAYTRRGAEMVSRISLILAMGEKERNEEHMLWAYGFVKRDIQDKIIMTNANTATDTGNAIISRIMSILDSTHGVSLAVIKNKMKNVKTDVIEKAIDYLTGKGDIKMIESKPQRGKATVKFYRN